MGGVIDGRGVLGIVGLGEEQPVLDPAECVGELL